MPVRLITALALAVAGLTVVSAPASAEEVCVIIGKNPDGSTAYKCTDVTEGGQTGGENGSGSSGGNEATCDLTNGLYDEFCIGTAGCFVNDPAALQDTDDNGLSEADKPDPDSYAVYWQCQRPDGSQFDRYYWNDDQPVVTVADRVRSAVGALKLPVITASFNPPTRTLVNLPTWWWAEGAPVGEIAGSEALGMVAHAVPRGLSISPGDGAAAVACPMSVRKSDACSHSYRRSGDFTASVSIVYDLRFEIGGTPLPVADVPAEYRTVTVDDDVAVAVREVQTKVTKVR